MRIETSRLVIRSVEPGDAKAWLSVEGKGPEIEIAYHLSSRLCSRARVIAVIMPENIGSQRVAEKAGMRFDSIATYFDIPGLRKYVADCDSWISTSNRPRS